MTGGNLRELALSLAVAGLFLSYACAQHKAGLRIYNGASVPIEQVTVMFPEDTVTFADIGPNVMGSYQPLRHGVGRDASFSFLVNGARIEQFVVDFVG